MYRDLPTDKFNTIVIDPPWRQSMAGRFKAVDRPEQLPYRTLSLEEIKAFPLSQLANTGCHVYTWTTNKLLPDTFEVLRSWGVNYHLTMPLVKPCGIAPCCGYAFAAEYCLLGFFGKPMQRFTSMGKLNWLQAKPTAHSAKPDAFYELVETMSPGPRVDLFARQPRNNFVSWGDELEDK